MIYNKLGGISIRKLFLILFCLVLTGCSVFGKDDQTKEKKDTEIVDKSEDDAMNTTTDSSEKTPLTIRPTEENFQNLYVLGKVWGFLKYYHPTIAEGEYDWDQKLFDILPEVVEAKNAKERDQILSEWITSLGTFEVKGSATEYPDETKMKPDLSWITNLNLDSKLEEQLKTIKRAKRPDHHHYVDLAPNVGNPKFKNEKSYEEIDHPQVDMRLLSLYRYWNIIEYFFPYKYAIEGNWDHTLKSFIPKLISEEKPYQLTMMELIASIHDTHGQILGESDDLNNYFGKNISPYFVEFVEGKAVVTDYINEELAKKGSLQIGDIIIEINEEPVSDIVDEKLKYISASNYTTKLRELGLKLLRTNEDTLTVQIDRDGVKDTYEIDVHTSSRLGIKHFSPVQRDIDPFRKLDGNIAYIYTGSLKNKDLPDLLPKIKDSKGLIIDLRSYPSDFMVFTFGQHLIKKPKPFVRFSTGSIQEPGLFTMTPTLSVGKYNKDYYKGKVVILNNQWTQSQAEYTTMAFRKGENVTVIGSQTAGADGNISRFSLPGGLKTVISGIGVYYPDGKETQRIGIVPDIEVKPTIQGIREGRDEVLEKAIEVINQ